MDDNFFYNFLISNIFYIYLLYIYIYYIYLSLIFLIFFAFLLSFTLFFILKISRYLHCKDTIPKIRNKYATKELRGYNPNSYIHVFENDFYIPPIGLPI
jgi:hypothetical protein